MRAFGEPHSKAVHMGAPTNAAYVKKVLANSEPSTQGGGATVAGERLRGSFQSVSATDNWKAGLSF
jgi:hypothetical protein